MFGLFPSNSLAGSAIQIQQQISSSLSSLPVASGAVLLTSLSGPRSLRLLRRPGRQQDDNAARNEASPQATTEAVELCPESLLHTASALSRSKHPLASQLMQCKDHLKATSSIQVRVDPLHRNAVEQIRSSSRPVAYKSSNTFFENIYGFPADATGKANVGLQLRSTRSLRLFPQSIALQPARTFYTRRTSGEGRVPFSGRRDAAAAAAASPSATSSTEESEVIQQLRKLIYKESDKDTAMKKIQRYVESNAIEDKDRLLKAAVHGYELGKTKTEGKGEGFAGLAAGKSSAQADDATSALASKAATVSDSLWNFLKKISAILIISWSTLWVLQYLNIRVKIFGGPNEIAPEEIMVTFDDVRGCDEAKQELQEIVDFLMNPDKFSALGGKLPKGVLLVGPPGTGKTLLARAVAGQAGVPFFHASGSEFDEILVGQGARRVRDLFRVAKSRAPCVIFIDEIDSVGSKRTSSALHPYANQTINQLLSEMDGFVSNEGVIVLGATNRASELDKALLRPGRFDTQVTVPLPDIKGRKEILNLYLGRIKHDDSINVDKLAKMTTGFSGADLENMVNTSAIRAAVEGKKLVSMSEFEYSHDKHVLGTDWKSRVRDKEDLRITAYHEAGHALVAVFTEDAEPLHKVTIVSKGQSGGHTAFLPERDRSHVTKSQILASMDVAMGGRAAEELIFGKEKITGGASSDLQNATNRAEWMVKKVGMSEKIGLRVIPDQEGVFGQGAANMLGPGTVETMDAEVNKMLTDSYKRATSILKAHKQELDLLAEALLNYETLDADDVKSIVQGEKVPFTKSTSNGLVLSAHSGQQGGLKSGGRGPNHLGGPEALGQRS